MYDTLYRISYTMNPAYTGWLIFVPLKNYGDIAGHFARTAAFQIMICLSGARSFIYGF